jgi:hypothetical protein
MSQKLVLLTFMEILPGVSGTLDLAATFGFEAWRPATGNRLHSGNVPVILSAAKDLRARLRTRSFAALRMTVPSAITRRVAAFYPSADTDES